MDTFEKDGWSITYAEDLEGTVVLTNALQRFAFGVPGDILKAWLDHAGYTLVPKEGMAGEITSILANYDADKVVRELQEFIDEDDTTEGNSEEGDG